MDSLFKRIFNQKKNWTILARWAGLNNRSTDRQYKRLKMSTDLEADIYLSWQKPTFQKTTHI